MCSKRMFKYRKLLLKWLSLQFKSWFIDGLSKRDVRFKKLNGGRTGKKIKYEWGQGWELGKNVRKDSCP